DSGGFLRGYADDPHEPLAQLLGHGHELVYRRRAGAPQQPILAIRAIRVEHVPSVLAVNSDRNAGEQSGDGAVEGPDIAAVHDIRTKRLEQAKEAQIRG